MTRIQRKFEELADRGERALVTYAMAGYPSEDESLSIVRGMVRGGADVIEIGFPFSDPLADGPVIQHAATESLRNGMTVGNFLRLVRQIRSETDVPLALMTYANVLYHRGYHSMIRDCVNAGIDGFIIPDMALEESPEYLEATHSCDADSIFLVSPNTRPERIRRIAAVSTGFLYLVAVYGTTGTRSGVEEYAKKAVRRTKRNAGAMPVGAGFGISSPSHVKEYMSAGADAAVVGSSFIKIAQETPPGRLEVGVASLTRRLKRATVSDA